MMLQQESLGITQLGSRGGAPKEVAPHHPPTQIHICARGVRPPTQKNCLGCWTGVTTHLQRHVYETFFWYFLFIVYFFCVFSINFVFIRSMVLLCFYLTSAGQIAVLISLSRSRVFLAGWDPGSRHIYCPKLHGPVGSRATWRPG